MKIKIYTWLTALTLTIFGICSLFAENPSAGKVEKDNYPTDKCIVSDEKLGEHGKPYIYIHKTKDSDGKEVSTEIRFCCRDCLKDFKKDPDTYLKKLEDTKKAKDEDSKKVTPSQPEGTSSKEEKE